MKEPIVCYGSAGADILIADLCVDGVWKSQTEALLDIRMVDTDARLYNASIPPLSFEYCWGWKEM